ncbi:MAG: rod shape-determining protein MreC [Candidatus Paceibacterota bacterium]
MKSLRSFVILFILLLLIIVIFFSKFSISSFINNISDRMNNIFSSTYSLEEFEKIKLENQKLKSEIENLEKSIISNRGEELEGFVYSRYPFSGKENIIINLGKKDGVSEEMAVLTEEGFLLGKVINVNNFTSEIETIFNSEWKSSASVGLENKAVLIGGNNLKLDLVSKQALLSTGDEVLNSSSEFPFNSLIGFVNEVKNNSSDTWLEVSVNVPYSLNEVRKVIVLTQFP